MATEQPSTLEFQCAHCDARLNVKAWLAGKKINCPKCHKKILVPTKNGTVASVPEDLATPLKKTPDTKTVKPATTPATTRKPAAPAAPPPPSTTEPPASAAPNPASGAAKPSSPPEPPASAAPPPADSGRLTELEREVGKKDALLAEREKELLALRSAMENRQRELAARDADLEKLRAETQKTRAQPAPPDDQARREKERQAADLERARQQVAALEQQLADARREAATARAQPSGHDGGGASTAGNDEEPDPDRLIAGLQRSTLRRGLRISIFGHAALLLLTSLGFLYWSLRGGRPEPEPESPAAAQPETRQPSERETQRREAALALETPAATRGVAERPPETERPRSRIEEIIESLPEPGETPRPSDVSLDLDL